MKSARLACFRLRERATRYHQEDERFDRKNGHYFPREVSRQEKIQHREIKENIKIYNPESRI